MAENCCPPRLTMQRRDPLHPTWCVLSCVGHAPDPAWPTFSSHLPASLAPFRVYNNENERNSNSHNNSPFGPLETPRVPSTPQGFFQGTNALRLVAALQSLRTISLRLVKLRGGLLPWDRPLLPAKETRHSPHFA